MSATSTAPMAGATALPRLRPSLKVPVSLGVLALIALIFFGLMGPDQTAEMKISDPGDAFAVPALMIPGQVGGIVLAILLLAMAGYSIFLWTRGERSPKWLPIAFAVVFVFALLVGLLPVHASRPSPSPAWLRVL